MFLLMHCMYSIIILRAERENHQSYSCQSLSSLEKKACKAVWKLISMFAYAHFIPSCTPFCFKATERKVEPQLNSNADAIKCRNTERRMWLRMFMPYRLPCVSAKTRLHSRCDLYWIWSGTEIKYIWTTGYNSHLKIDVWCFFLFKVIPFTY